MSIEFRELETVAELTTTVDLEIAVWQMLPRDAVPLNILRAMALHGGLILGAYDGDKLIGMSLAFPMRPGGRYVLWSHMAGVHPDYQGQNIGFGIKQAQRVWALEHGYDEMRWTYDPLLRGNANFNLHRLGATAAIYHVNYYGRMEDEINILEDSDRLEVIWKLKSPRVKKLAAGNDSIVDDQPFSADEFALTIDKSGKPALNPNCALDAERFFVPIPRSISGFDLDTAQSWRLTLREMLQDAFERGYVAVDFVEQDSTCGYILHAPTPYYLYVARCQDDSLYTGITNNLHKRLQQHNSGKGAAYTRSRRPVTLLGAWKFRNRSQALQAEAAFKQQTRAAKLTRLDKGGQYRESINFLVEIT